MRQPLTADLLHRLVAGSHAEGTTRLAVALLIEDHEQILLINTDHCWDVPGGLVLPGETLDAAVYRTAAAAGIDIDRITGYLGHHDLPADHDLVRTFIFAATTRHPGRASRPALQWAAADDLPDGIDGDILAFIYLAVPTVHVDSPDHDQQLSAALRAHARGLLAVEAAVELLIGHRAWLHRDDFVDHYVDTPGLANPTPMARVDWPAAITALETGALACSSGEGQMLRIAASLADGIPVDLRDALTGLDTDTLDLVTQAVLHTGGR